jgi:hypothetical protein
MVAAPKLLTTPLCPPTLRCPTSRTPSPSPSKCSRLRLPPRAIVYCPHVVGQEKEARIKEGMLIMGMRPSVFWSGWAVTAVITSLYVSILVILAGAPPPLPICISHHPHPQASMLSLQYPQCP